MRTFRCARFPTGPAKIRTTAGIVAFDAGMATVEDDALAEALLEVPEVFGISEYFGDPVPEGHETKPSRPARSASKDAWMAYVLATVSISEEQARGMTKDQLIQLAG